MAKSTKSKSTKKQVKVKDLPEAEAKLTGKQMKKVKGGWVWSSFEGLVDPAAKAGAAKGGSWPK